MMMAQKVKQLWPGTKQKVRLHFHLYFFILLITFTHTLLATISYYFVPETIKLSTTPPVKVVTAGKTKAKKGTDKTLQVTMRPYVKLEKGVAPKQKSSGDKEVIELFDSDSNQEPSTPIKLEPKPEPTKPEPAPVKGSKKDKKKKPFYDAANEVFQTQMKRNMNPVSFVGKKEETTLDNTVSPKLEGDQGPLEKPMDKKLNCAACKQLHDFCHRKVYSDYIKKKIFYDYKNKTNYPDSDEIQAKIKEAYNEKRRVDVHLHFNFYDGAVYPLLNCLYGYSWELVHMVNDLTECARINHDTKNGIVEFIRAKRHRKA